jgi:quercetin dioxygenase-like cupin family protein
MTLNQKYANTVESGSYPSDVNVPLDDSFVDQRGEILNILLSPITSVARITSKKGSVRANHFHKTDWHYAFVEAGKVLYFEREIGALTVPEPIVFLPGQMFFTKPNIEHAMLFVEDSTIYTFAKNIRSHDSHESDLVRVSFVTQDIIDRYVS